MDKSDPIFALIFFVGACYLFSLFWKDLVTYKKTKTIHPKAFEGALPAGRPILVFAVVGAIILLAMQVLFEYATGTVQEQTEIGYFAILTLIASAFIEELIFRGYIVVKNKGLVLLWVFNILFSLIFALMHPYVWDWIANEESVLGGALEFNFTLKTIGSTAFMFINSLFFYFLRFNKFNKNMSIIPCILSHLAFNLGVFAVKLCQGFVV